MALERNLAHPKIKTLRHTAPIERNSVEAGAASSHPSPIKNLFRGCTISKDSGEDPRLGVYTSVKSNTEPGKSPLYYRELKVYHDTQGHETGYEWETYSKSDIKRNFAMTSDFVEGSVTYNRHRRISWHIGMTDGKVTSQHYSFPDGMGSWDVKDLSRSQIKELKRAGFDPNLLLVLSQLVTKKKGEKMELNARTASKLFPALMLDEGAAVLSGLMTISGIVMSQMTDIREERLAAAAAVFLGSIYKTIKDVSLIAVHQNDQDAVDAAKSLAWQSKDLQLILSAYSNSLLYLFRK